MKTHVIGPGGQKPGADIANGAAAPRRWRWRWRRWRLLCVALVTVVGVLVWTSRDAALRKAAFRGSGFKVELWLLLGADPNAVDPHGHTALMYAAASIGDGQDRIVEALLQHGANLEARSAGGWTALAIAANVGNQKTFQQLLQQGATVGARDDKGRTLLHDAVFFCPQCYMTGMYQEMYWPPNPYSCAQRGYRALRHTKSSIVRQLLTAGSEVDARDQNGQTPLMYAVMPMLAYQDKEVVRLLLESDADINARDAAGKTMLSHFREAMPRDREGEYQPLLDFLINQGATE